jgi:hypothetical protein
MFGTYTEEKAEPRYGILKQLDGHNPLWANTHGWHETWKNVSLRDGIVPSLKTIFGSPYRIGE